MTGELPLREALRTTGAVRRFRREAVPRALVAAVLDDARFAPNGGNRQPWHVVLVEDPARRRRLRDLYLPGWREYLTLVDAGLTPFAPTNDRAAEAGLLADVDDGRRLGAFADGFDEHPVLLAVLAHLDRLAATDRDLERYTFAGGASVYPFVAHLLLSARLHGLGGVMTTVHQRVEPAVLEVLGAPEGMALAAVVALGWPEAPWPRSLTREPVPSFATVDTVAGPPVGGTDREEPT